MNYFNFTSNFSGVKFFSGLTKKFINKLSGHLLECSKLLKFRLNALKKLESLRNPDWSFYETPDFSFDNLCYYSEPGIDLKNPKIKTELDETLKKLGLTQEFDSKNEFGNMAMDIILDSISVKTTAELFLRKTGNIFIPLFKALKFYPNLVLKYLGTIVPYSDNFYSALNSSVFSEGSFCFIPKDIKCMFDFSTYFRTNSENFAQFERTLIVVEDNSCLTYLEGCTAPSFKESQLHIAIVEILVKNYSKVKYSTIQNWYRGTSLGNGGVFNLTTKRGICLKKAYLEWVQIEIGSSLTWKYPSTILKELGSCSNFYSVSLVSDFQIADTGTKMIHVGSKTISNIFSKSLSFNSSINIYRGLVNIKPSAFKSINYTQCDSLIIGNKSLISTIPYSCVNNFTSVIRQEAYISKLDKYILFFLTQRGLSLKIAFSLLIIGFCSKISEKLPVEFEAEIPLLFLTRTGEFLNN